MLIPIKIICGCGQKYAFDVSPVNGRMPAPIRCPRCGADGKPTRSTLEQEAPPPLLRRWDSLVLGGADYKNFGELIAWRATLWRDDQLLSEQKSFLW
jgi:hypothetical protein